jgi:hypothetical protein
VPEHGESLFSRIGLGNTERSAAREQRWTNCWAVVRVLKGKGVIEDLMFDGVPAAEYLRDQRPVK